MKKTIFLLAAFLMSSACHAQETPVAEAPPTVATEETTSTDADPSAGENSPNLVTVSTKVETQPQTRPEVAEAKPNSAAAPKAEAKSDTSGVAKKQAPVAPPKVIPPPPVKPNIKHKSMNLPPRSIVDRLVANGAPRRGMQMMYDFMVRNVGAENTQDTYICANRDPESVKPCDERQRIRSSRIVVLTPHQWAAYIDYSKPSTEKRFYLINWRTASVRRYLVTHGKGSGDGAVAYRFSNRKDSLMTSLGFYISGLIYSGSYGTTLRMYGLEKSNDEAYNRDIVLHGAWYAKKDFFNNINHRTKEPYGRLGVSWGCPALDPALAREVIPLLQDGSLIFHDHPGLREESLSGRQVSMTPPAPPVAKPKPVEVKPESTKPAVDVKPTKEPTTPAVAS